MLSVIANTNYWNICALNQLNQLLPNMVTQYKSANTLMHQRTYLHSSAIFIASHPIHLIHNDSMKVGLLGSASLTCEGSDGGILQLGC